MGTHDNPSFGKEKAVPGVAYIKSEAYRTRFGYNNGRWLVVINGGTRRMHNLMQQTEERVGEDAKMFYFTTFEQLFGVNVLASPIWWQSKQTSPRILLS